MLDFLIVSTRSPKKGITEVYPIFKVMKSSDLMIRGGDFYAVWDSATNLWSTDEDDLIRLVDAELYSYAEQYTGDDVIRVLSMRNGDTKMIDKWHNYCKHQMRDSYHMLDENIIFSNVETKKKDYASKKLNYPLERGDISAYDRLMSTLYDEDERHKIEWAIGSVISGDSKKIQKFMVLYGAAGTGKSTVLNIIQKLFEGYYSVFDAKALGSSSNTFALEVFKSNPLVAVQHDGDLSRIDDNTRLNSLVSHELMTVNEKFKSTYSTRFKCFLFMGTNKPVKITDGRSGLLRRLIDVSPSGRKLNIGEYNRLVKQIDFELGAIAQHCLDVYLDDPGCYDGYTPTLMLGASNDFYNFIIDSYRIFAEDDSTTLKVAWEMYKNYCEEANVLYPYSRMNFKEELKNYFWNYEDRFSDGDRRVRSYYSGFRRDKFELKHSSKDEHAATLKLNCHKSIFDSECATYPAQYANEEEKPLKKWSDVTTTLADIDTSKLHYVRVPKNHIVIDFDLKDENGNKDLKRNIEEANKWPPTYAELSKSGSGVHLHYIYTGDVDRLSRVYKDHIEIKVFLGRSSLRRKLTRCNNLPITVISSGLPLKEEKQKMVNYESITNDAKLHEMIIKTLKKEYDNIPSTKSGIDFINHILEDAYASGIHYDVHDLYNDIVSFAMNSTNQADKCLKIVSKMHFSSDEPSEPIAYPKNSQDVIFDVEVYPNLLLICWKLYGEGNPVNVMYNPTAEMVQQLTEMGLIGFNNRRYDNHILYARILGYNNEQIFQLSKDIINNKENSNKPFFREAYNISKTDVFDFSSMKQSLKKWEIALKSPHKEMDLPWDQPVPKEKWEAVAEYCKNDVLATEKVFDHLKADWLAREILADLAGMTVNDTTNTLTTHIIVGKDRNPELIYTDLATGEQYDIRENHISNSFKETNKFEGYEYSYDNNDKKYHNMYRGTDVGRGGYVYARPGMYGNVALLDIASLHPNSAIQMNYFGKYTKNFKDILDARLAIKHKDFDTARNMLKGKLAPYLEDESKADDLAYALKIAINSVYGLTSATFQNTFTIPQNRNNIVALRGALFMRLLQDEVTKMGYTVAHIKTDSIKIPDADNRIIKFVTEFGKKYGYTFEHEATYERMCLVNDAVYIAKYATVDQCCDIYGSEYVMSNKDICKDNKKHPGQWTATGTQFQVPYVFKTLFSKENIIFDDLCETKSVTTTMYLDQNEQLPDGEHDYHFIGRVGSFCPVKPGCGGGRLVREGKDKAGNVKYDSVVGTKDYRWVEALTIENTEYESEIDYAYFNKLVDKAIEAIRKYGDFEWFISDSPYSGSWLEADNTIPF